MMQTNGIHDVRYSNLMAQRCGTETTKRRPREMQSEERNALGEIGMVALQSQCHRRRDELQAGEMKDNI